MISVLRRSAPNRQRSVRRGRANAVLSYEAIHAWTLMQLWPHSLNIRGQFEICGQLSNIQPKLIAMA